MPTHFPGPMEIVFLLFTAALMVGIFIWPLWTICTKAGLPGALSLLVVIPFGIVIVLFILALTDWPTLRRQTASSD